MEVHLISSSTALLFLSSANFCTDAQCLHVQILLKLAGRQHCLHTGQLSVQVSLFQYSEDIFILSSTDCVSRQEATWVCYCFAWMISDYCPLWMWGLVPCFGPSELQLSPHIPQPNQLKMVMAITPHCPLPAWKPATEKLHLITGPDSACRVCVQWLIQWIWHAEMSLNCIIPAKKHLDTLRKQI